MKKNPKPSWMRKPPTERKPYTGPGWIWGVFRWNEEGRYPLANAIQTFKTQRAAEQYIRTHDPNAAKNWVPRPIAVSANPNRRNQKLGVIVTRPKPKRKANPRMVKIYAKITRVEGEKGSDSKFPCERFYHNFSKPYPAMYGTPDRKTLIIKKG